MLHTAFFSRPGSLYQELSRVQRQMDALLNQALGGTGNIRESRPDVYPALNIGTSPDAVHVYLFASGLDPEKLDVSLEQNVLTISGERKDAVDENEKFYTRERFQGEFRRAVSLPEDIDPDQVEASYNDGVLHIVVKRQESSKPRQIEVKS